MSKQTQVRAKSRELFFRKEAQELSRRTSMLQRAAAEIGIKSVQKCI